MSDAGRMPSGRCAECDEFLSGEEMKGVDRLLCERCELREAVRELRRPPIGDWCLTWFGENAPAHEKGGYTFAQIADCANYLGKHLDLLAAHLVEEPGDGA